MVKKNTNWSFRIIVIVHTMLQKEAFEWQNGTIEFRVLYTEDHVICEQK